MDYFELMRKRRELKRQLVELKANRKPEEIIKLKRESLVLADNGYKVVVREVETTVKEEQLLAEITRLKMLMNQPLLSQA
ncbi:hypothetical protein MOA67_gp139 [Klebsiella phage KpLz-2_45]|uniref:hypothetical protein n=1 Tax=Klebsiella phage KpLz-2_45 TaxID=2698923 RepID=UPI001F13DCEE|nr:hypothetical protein MOA67_gp139 [Klebsiella phage KpLz-2_45]UKS72005.1 hypothetical protein KpLz245_1390 [Klebsiella phage KpLz-2_45]